MPACLFLTFELLGTIFSDASKSILLKNVLFFSLPVLHDHTFNQTHSAQSHYLNQDILLLFFLRFIIICEPLSDLGFRLLKLLALVLGLKGV